MKTKTANIVNFYDLSVEWQKEAISNLDEYAQENYYLEPDCEYDPDIVLWDLAECMPTKGTHEGFEYNAAIGISNNSAMLLNIDEDFDCCTYIYI